MIHTMVFNISYHNFYGLGILLNSSYGDSLWGFLMGVSYGEILCGFSTVLCKPMTSHASPCQPWPAQHGPAQPSPAALIRNPLKKAQ